MMLIDFWSVKNMSKDIKNDNQKRLWLAIIYPEKEDRHSLLLDMIRSSYYSYFYINHVAKFDEEGKQLNESHTHLGIIFPSATRKSTLLNSFNLPLTDQHLFKSLDEFKYKNGQRKFKTLEDYISYCTHLQQDDKPDKYYFDDFITNMPERVQRAIDSSDMTSYESFNSLFNWLDKEFKDHPDMHLWDIAMVYKYCCDNGYGNLYYKHWNRINKLVSCYITNIN